MKNTFFIILILASFISCKKNTQIKQQNATTTLTPKENDNLPLIKGDFIYYADAAVIKTVSKIYGVVIDHQMHELDKQVKPYKKKSTDMVPVEIKGKIIPKPENEEGWPLKIEIKKVLKVSKPNNKNIIKLKS